ncbi:MAG TPA: 5-(carboxyamino)imidazole ribonucleotide mutase [Candidatus Kapabacteria bacterium]|nr:5-(carboxyamino)imidazole ribonucleotide mutase [Candidatus Kapabacteria bacterium]
MADVVIVLGSTSDEAVMKSCEEYLAYFQIPYEKHIISAHRQPEQTADFAKNLVKNNVKVAIAAAGMAAHLPGVLASFTTIPVIGVPLGGSELNGVDALYSIVQMPAGIPVATVAIGSAGAKNAAVLAAQILALSDNRLRQMLLDFKKNNCKIPSAVKK